MLGFSSRANWRNCCTARCWSIWYRLFIATLSFSWQKKPPSAHYDRGCESRYFLRINGHPHFHTPQYIVLLGAVDVIPHQDLQNPAYNPGRPDDDPDQIVPSDLPYACAAPYSQNAADFIAPARVV